MSTKRTKSRTRARVFSAARIQIKAAGMESFAQKCQLSREGCFVATKSPLTAGRVIALSVVTVDGKTLFAADGKVGWTQPPWQVEPHVPGMWIEFTTLGPSSTWVLDRLFGKTDTPLPDDAPIAIDGDVEAIEIDPDELLLFDDEVEELSPVSIPQLELEPLENPTEPIDIGIDLGTTFTCAATIINGSARVFHLDDGYRTMPSVVFIKDRENVIVGRTALDSMVKESMRTIYGSKRLLGRKFGSKPVKDAQKYFDYQVVSGEGGDAAVSVGGETYEIPWVAAQILKEVATWVRHQANAEIRRCVITVPAHYNTRQRQAVLHAARLAGLRARQIVNEPTAAALAYGVDRGFEPQRILVYDLGGGTFDVAVLELQGNMFEVLATGGDPYLGGNDFDARVIDWMLGAFNKKVGIDLTGDPIVKLRLRQASEAAKIELSDESEAHIFLPYVAKRGAQVLNLEAKLKRETLNKLVMDLVDRTLEICDETLRSAELSREDIDEVLLVGGQTRMPLVEGKVAAFIGRRPRMGVHPDEAAAVGAAQLAASLDSTEHVALTDLVGMPIGVALEGRFRSVVRKNTALPADKRITIPTVMDNQRSMSVDIYQGDTGQLEGNEYLGTVDIKLPARPKGLGVQVHFAVDKHGFLTVYTSYSGAGRRRAAPLIVKERSERLR